MTAPVARVSDRATFVFLRACRRHANRLVWVRWFDDRSSPPRVAFSVGRSIGPAVVRNRVRRRLRACVEREAPARTGAWVVGASPDAVEASFDELRQAVADAMGRASASVLGDGAP